MRVYFKEYGWIRVSFMTWALAAFRCRSGIHNWATLGDPCYCGSDNCFVCAGCEYETHD